MFSRTRVSVCMSEEERRTLSLPRSTPKTPSNKLCTIKNSQRRTGERIEERKQQLKHELVIRVTSGAASRLRTLVCDPAPAPLLPACEEWHSKTKLRLISRGSTQLEMWQRGAQIDAKRKC